MDSYCQNACPYSQRSVVKASAAFTTSSHVRAPPVPQPHASDTAAPEGQAATLPAGLGQCTMILIPDSVLCCSMRWSKSVLHAPMVERWHSLLAFNICADAGCMSWQMPWIKTNLYRQHCVLLVC